MTENKDKKPMIRIRGANENNLKNISLNMWNSRFRHGIWKG